MAFRVALAYSTRDPAGRGAARELASMLGAERHECPMARECLLLAGRIALAGFDEDTPFMEFLDETPDPGAEAVVVLSRHSSESGLKALTVHHTGNPTDRTFGGEPRTLAVAYPALSRALLRAYRDAAGEEGILGEYDLKLEATHHGPTRPHKPIVFIEIGSGPSEWSDARAHRAMALAVAHVLETGPSPDCVPAAGFGGGHYPVKFTKVHLDGEYCMGHIIPKYAVREGVDAGVVRQAVEKAYPQPARAALVEKKSLRSAERREIVSALEEIGVTVVYV